MSEIQDVLTRTESPPSRQLWLWRREKMWRADDRAEASSASGLQRLLRNDRGQWRGHDSASLLSPLFGPVPPPITSFHSLEIIHIHSKAISFYRVKPKKWPFSILLYCYLIYVMDFKTFFLFNSCPFNPKGFLKQSLQKQLSLLQSTSHTDFKSTYVALATTWHVFAIEIL